MAFCIRVKCPDGQWDTSLAFVYLVQRNVWFPNSYLDKQHADNKVQQGWKGKEFIEGWGLSCWLHWCWWEGRSLSGAKGQRSAACTQQLS